MNIENSRKIMLGSLMQSLNKRLVLGKINTQSIVLYSILNYYFNYLISQNSLGNTEVYSKQRTLSKLIFDLKYNCEEICTYKNRMINQGQGFKSPPIVRLFQNPVEIVISAQNNLIVNSAPYVEGVVALQNSSFEGDLVPEISTNFQLFDSTKDIFKSTITHLEDKIELEQEIVSISSFGELNSEAPSIVKNFLPTTGRLDSTLTLKNASFFSYQFQIDVQDLEGTQDTKVLVINVTSPPKVLEPVNTTFSVTNAENTSIDENSPIGTVTNFETGTTTTRIRFLVAAKAGILNTSLNYISGTGIDVFSIGNSNVQFNENLPAIHNNSGETSFFSDLILVNLEEGNHTLMISVQDFEGQIDTKTLSFNVVYEEIPLIELSNYNLEVLSPTSTGEQLVDAVITYNGTENLLYNWELIEGDNTVILVESNVEDLQLQNLKVGQYTLKLTVTTDINNFTVSEESVITVTAETIPSISATGFSAAEGNIVNFTLNLSETSSQNIFVDFEILHQTANEFDYNLNPLSPITILAGETSYNIELELIDEEVYEGTENLFLNIIEAKTSITNDILNKLPGTYQGEILDGSTPPFLNISDAIAIDEGENSMFTLTLSKQSSETIIVQLSLQDISTDVNDFSHNPIQVTFNPGETFKTVEVATYLDFEPESTETFTLNLSNVVQGTLNTGDHQGIGTILEVPNPINNSPIVSNSVLNIGQGPVFQETSETSFQPINFINNFTDAEGDSPREVLLLPSPLVGELTYEDSPIPNNFTFLISNSDKLKYVIQNVREENDGVYQYSQNIDTQIAQLIADGYTLQSYSQGQHVYTKEEENIINSNVDATFDSIPTTNGISISNVEGAGWENGEGTADIIDGEVEDHIFNSSSNSNIAKGTPPSPQGGNFAAGIGYDQGNFGEELLTRIDVVQGVEYTVSFQQVHAGGVTTLSGGTTNQSTSIGNTASWQVTFDGQTQNSNPMPFLGHGSQVWEDEQLTFIAQNTGEIILSFRAGSDTTAASDSQNNWAYLGVDNVMVTTGSTSTLTETITGTLIQDSLEFQVSDDNENSLYSNTANVQIR